MIKILLFILSNIFIMNEVYAEEIYVICTSRNKSWNWLVINNQFVSVNGEWQSQYANINEDIYRVINYFQIEEDKVIEFQSECQKQFGPSFLYAQAAYSKFSGWFLFGKERKLFAGVAKISYCFFTSQQTDSSDMCVPRTKIIEPL
ncbi:hypothetical protein [Silvanigrella sp.]|uniref:hypothetical protein n=1 Tax=Silvanigrella sp. TaxID=2024976 RepID=UPI0037C5B314